jgi:tRNA A-37 threonylcarbamoyl transferase component Bud32
MPANLPLRLLPPTRREPAPAPPPVAPPAPAGTIVFHPRYWAWLVRSGVGTAAAALDLQGEIVSGHPDRHVVRVQLRGRVVYLKREHAVRWKVRFRNRRAGFGPVSRCEREADTLRALEAAGLPGPQWLAYGTDAAGRAFLLVDEVANAADVRTVLADTAMSQPDRRLLAERAGRAIAELHEAGFGTPDLAAKHLLVGAASGAVTLIDWQSAEKPGPVPDAARARQLAGLDASLADDLATPAERRRFLWAYLRVVRRTRKPDGPPAPRFGRLARNIAESSGKLRDRSSARDQRQRPAAAQRLVWLAGEEVCVVPELVDAWPTPANGSPFYPDAGDPAGPREWVTFPGGRRARLARFATFAPLGRWLASVRGKSWRSPGAKLSRLMFHLARYGVPGPRLLAFGQRLDTPTAARSFVLYEPPADAVPFARRLAQLPDDSRERRLLVRASGAFLRKLHDAGCRLTREPGLAVLADGSLTVDSPFAVRLAGTVGELGRRLDLRTLSRGLSRTDALRLVRGYAGYAPRSRG